MKPRNVRRICSGYGQDVSRVSYLVRYAGLPQRAVDEEGWEAFQTRVLDFEDSPEEEERAETSTP
jgi:hypothetical protein